MKIKHSIILLSLWFMPLWVYGHGGGTDSYGCHNQTSTNTYHCHSGSYNGQSFSSKDAFLAFIGSAPSTPSTSTNAKPTVSITAGNRTISDTDQKAGESFTISATATDTDGSITSTIWIVNGLTLASGTAAVLSLGDGTHIVTFQASDNSGAISSTSVTVTIAAASAISTVYNRDDYLPDWADADGDCINTRHEVLILESLITVTMSSSGCTVTLGKWYDPYTGLTFTNPSDVDIDHFVPLREAHDSGAYLWTTVQKRAFANDLLRANALIAVDDGTNSSKSDRDPAAWLPPNSAYRCEYVKNWIEIKSEYNLSIDNAERTAIESILGTDISRGYRTKIKGVKSTTGGSSASFQMGLVKNGDCAYSQAPLANDTLEIDFVITPEPDDLDQSADVFLVVDLNGAVYSISATGKLVPFGGSIASLEPFKKSIVFRESYEFSFFQGVFGSAIKLTIFVAYLTAGGDFVYTGSPFTLLVN